MQKLYTALSDYTLERSVLPIQSSDVCSKNKANKKECVQNSRQSKGSRCSAFSILQAMKHPCNIWRVGCAACIIFCFQELKSFFNTCVLNLFKNLNLCTSYIGLKQKMNVSHLCNGTNISI